MGSITIAGLFVVLKGQVKVSKLQEVHIDVDFSVAKPCWTVTLPSKHCAVDVVSQL